MRGMTKTEASKVEALTDRLLDVFEEGKGDTRVSLLALVELVADLVAITPDPEDAEANVMRHIRSRRRADVQRHFEVDDETRTLH